MAISHYNNLAPGPPHKLRSRHHQPLLQFLLQDLEANLFIISWLENYGVEANKRQDFTFWGYFNRSHRLRAAALNVADRLMMLDTRRKSDARGFGLFFRNQHVHFQHIVSRRDCVTPFWMIYSTPNPRFNARARLIQNQELYTLVPQNFSSTGFTSSAIRRAKLTEIDPVFLASVKMHREETGEDPLLRNPLAFRRHVHFRISNGRTFVWFDDRRRLLFKADISTLSSHGAQISGVYTAPDHRNQGIATRAMIGICRLLFNEGVPRLTLYVNETNHPARHLYQKIGFECLTPYQTIFVAD